MIKINKLKKILLTSAASFFAFLASALPAYAQTSSWSGVCVSQTDPDVATIQGLQCLMANVLSVFLTVLGITGFIMLIVGSMRWLLSGGNSQNVDKAGKTMTFAVVGIVVSLSSFIILRLIAEFTGVQTILNFSIPSSDKPW